jgi:nucleoside-diphosphate-sugar epimerase
MNRALVTGATGFIGRFLCDRFLQEGWSVSGTMRGSKRPSDLVVGVEPVLIESLGPNTSWQHCLDDISTVLHLGARVHIIHETAIDPCNEFHIINTEGTINLANQAAAKGVERFVFMSTIGVNGDNSENKSYTESDEPQPHNLYAISKYEAEQALWQISRETDMEIVIIRAPLVYGPGNPGNFLSLLNVVSTGIPLPLSLINNLRSQIYVGNLVDALAICALHPAAADNTYLVSDGEDISTPELIRRVACALGKPARLFPFPPNAVRLIGKYFFKRSALERLVSSLQVNSSKIKRELGWTPPFTMLQGLQKTAEWFGRKY